MLRTIGTTLTGKLEQAYRKVFTRYYSHFEQLILVTEFPKSGGTWLGQLVSGYFGISFPRNCFPSFEPALIHSHYLPQEGYKNLHKVLWLIRDGRDVMVSLYHHHLIWNEKNRLNPKNVHYHRSKVPFNDFDNVKENMPAFIEYVFTHKPSRVQQYTHPGSWVSFNRQWLDAYRTKHLDIYQVKYEDLLEDTNRELQNILVQGFDIESVDHDRVNRIVSQYSFENQTKRRQGEESKKSFLRKGISGDWKNYFNREAATVFNDYAGDMLIELNYEKNHSWVESLKV